MKNSSYEFQRKTPDSALSEVTSELVGREDRGKEETMKMPQNEKMVSSKA
jgi:hypothetical protein